MSDHELTEDDHEEINVLDTDSRLSHSESEPHSPCSSPDTGHNVTSPRTSVVSANHTLPFSISNLLGKNFEEKSETEAVSNVIYQQQPNIFPHRALLPTGFYTQAAGGVLRVPAHRPLGGPGSPAGTVFSPWALGLDPVLHRSAAAAAFATQVVKDRLSGKIYNSVIDLKDVCLSELTHSGLPSTLFREKQCL